MVPGFQICPNGAPNPRHGGDISDLPNKLEKGYRKGFQGESWWLLVISRGILVVIGELGILVVTGDS